MNYHINHLAINQSMYLFPLILYTRYGKRHSHKTTQCKLK